MDSASLNSLIPIFDDIDRWTELAPLLPVLVVLELILSADNAVALASISKRLNNLELQRLALNIGIFIALILRILLLLTANYIIKYPLFKFLASTYLFYIAIKFFYDKTNSNDAEVKLTDSSNNSLFEIICLLSVTDLAFSIDSVTAAVAISDQLILVLTGTLVGVIALRFTADLFIRWIEIYTNLEPAGYIAVAVVAIKLAIQIFVPLNDTFDIIFFASVIVILFWGFSVKVENSIR